jgi:hypothetical protein
MALRDYEYALWEQGFNCAVRKMKKLNTESRKTKAKIDALIKEANQENEKGKARSKVNPNFKFQADI